MNDNEKIAMLESEKIRMQFKINQQQALLEKACELLERLQENNDTTLKEWDKTVKALRFHWLL